MMDLVDDDDDVDGDVAHSSPGKKNFPATTTNQMVFIRYYFYIQPKNAWMCNAGLHCVYHLCMLEIDKSVQFIVVPLRFVIVCARQTMYTLHTYEWCVWCIWRRDREKENYVCHVFPSIILHKSRKHLLNCQSSCREQRNEQKETKKSD